MFVSMSDLGQATNKIQADNAYSKGRTALSAGNMAIARLSLSELQFTYNNAKNAGNESEAQEILRLVNLLNAAMNPAAPAITPQAAPQNFVIDMRTTKTDQGFAPSDGNLPGPAPVVVSAPPAQTNWLLWGGAALGGAALIGGGLWLLGRPRSE